jgi:hypothetical protein
MATDTNEFIDLMTRSRIQQDLKDTRESYTVIGRRYEVRPLLIAEIEADGVEEEWRVAVRDFDDQPRYLVSSKGKLKNLKTHRLSKGYLSPNNRVMVYLKVDGRKTVRSLAKLVASLFIPRDATMMYVRHLDGDPWNNAIENLCWAQFEAMAVKPKISEQDVVDIKLLYKAGLPRQELASLYNVTIDSITRINTGKAWKDVIV